MSMVRSVRIAVHPSLRRRGLAKTLVEHVHQSYAPDLFGTLFGATPELVRFRRSVGYELVRVGISRGARTGEPAAVMVHPLSERARALVRDLRIELARNLPVQLALMDADGELRVEPELATALSAGLAPAPPLGEDEMRTALRSYLLGPRPYESAAFALEQFVRAHEEKLSGMDAQERAVLEQRVLRRHGWERVAAEAGYPSVPAAMRALRQAMRALAGAVDPSLPDEG
jgi:tRNA(Met) cytidine acetyltransferase